MSEAMTHTSELLIERHFDAPRELVWRAFTERDALARWWGPVIFENTVISLDLRPGGMFHYEMRMQDGRQLWGRFIYGAILPPERLEYVSSFADAQGNAVRAPWDDQWPLETGNIITFTERDGGTLLTLRCAPLNASTLEQQKFEGMFGSMQQGYGGTLDQLGVWLAENTEKSL